VDEGAHWFKQDGANQVLEHPDRLWGNGMTDARMHNLYPLLYSRQMLQGFREHTGLRTFTFTPSGWAGLQALTGTWTGDTGGGEGPLVACLNLSLSGHGMNTCDMDVTTPAGIQFGMMLPWAQLNSWNYWRHPWLQGERLQAIFTDYARLRYRMLPYIYSLAREARETGLPMMRAMPLHWPDASDAYDCLRQYMFGPSLLVSAFTDEVWLPEGIWHNFCPTPSSAIYTPAVTGTSYHLTVSQSPTSEAAVYSTPTSAPTATFIDAPLPDGLQVVFIAEDILYLWKPDEVRKLLSLPLIYHPKLSGDGNWSKTGWQ
jgi:alpha-glucosidase (family GH31 glycosyl hydrolase)